MSEAVAGLHQRAPQGSGCLPPQGRRQPLRIPQTGFSLLSDNDSVVSSALDGRELCCQLLGSGAICRGRAYGSGRQGVNCRSNVFGHLTSTRGRCAACCTVAGTREGLRGQGGRGQGSIERACLCNTAAAVARRVARAEGPAQRHADRRQPRCTRACRCLTSFQQVFPP